MRHPQKTVYVGLSGGVDSSVTAALLLEQGHHVVGAYMKNWTQDIAGNQCPWEDDLRSAKSVAAHLGIELKVFDLQEEYRQRVVDVMVQAYARGLTPNPDILCNEDIKFSLFYNLCRADGADFVATGHYARMLEGRLMQAIDKKKDQTYFLYRMPTQSARQVLFPLGEYEKTEVRGLAKKYGLPTANRRESMGLCFVGKVPLKDFLGEFMDLQRPHP
ncbi:tRNA 2-thiouridine(34) synthase MnmA [bacterium]|nr:MAG: tRNA 2-thiouridine(34) synthase MnmA [bacterium]